MLLLKRTAILLFAKINALGFGSAIQHIYTTHGTAWWGCVFVCMCLYLPRIYKGCVFLRSSFSIGMG